MPAPLYRTFSHHYRQKYGHGVGKVPVDMGQPCPNRAHGGCIFCRPASFTPSCLKSTDTLNGQIRAGKSQLLQGRFVKYLGYFQQETSTAIALGQLLVAVDLLLADNDCVGLIISTRPDYVSDQLLELLAERIHASGKECLFELGLQSVHDRSLRWLNRRHSLADFVDSAQRIRKAGCFELGAHLILGIPGESQQDMLDTITTVCSYGINALKLHHLQVIRDTPLARLYRQGKVKLFTLDGYLDFLLQALPLIPAEVTIHRLWSTAHPALLVAPRWNVLASELSEQLRQKMTAAGCRQGQAAEPGHQAEED